MQLSIERSDQNVPIPNPDFYSGNFWQTPLGEAVQEFTTEQIIAKELSLPLTTSQVAKILGIKDGWGNKSIVPALLRSGLIAGFRRRLSYYCLNPEHLPVVGLVLLHLENGYPRKDLGERLIQMLEGTRLQSLVNRQWNYSMFKYRGIFAKSSRWPRFPLAEYSGYRRLQTSVYQADPTKLGEESSQIRPEESVRAQDESPVSSVRRKILLIEVDELGQTQQWDLSKVKKVFQILPMSTDTVDARNAPLTVVRKVIFIWAAHKRRLIDFNPYEDSYTLSAFRRGLGLVLIYMERYPKIGNLYQLFQAVSQEVVKNPEKYWAAAQS